MLKKNVLAVYIYRTLLGPVDKPKKSEHTEDTIETVG